MVHRNLGHHRIKRVTHRLDELWTIVRHDDSPRSDVKISLIRSIRPVTKPRTHAQVTLQFCNFSQTFRFGSGIDVSRPGRCRRHSAEPSDVKSHASDLCCGFGRKGAEYRTKPVPDTTRIEN